MVAVWVVVGTLVLGFTVYLAMAGWRVLTDMGDYQDELEDMLKDCRQQFLFYEQQHRAKGTAESLEKAHVNSEFAIRITEVLEDY